jgi:hypothetical protein
MMHWYEAMLRSHGTQLFHFSNLSDQVILREADNHRQTEAGPVACGKRGRLYGEQ